MNDPDLPECIACAACCFSKAENYVPVTGADYSRLGDAADEFAIFQNNKAFMKMKDGHCAALRFVEGHWLCSIYELRPTICRDLQRGSGECEAAIWQMRENR